jgi:hypothetical protein
VNAEPVGRGAEEVETNHPLDLEAFARALASPSPPPAESWRPWIIQLVPQDVERFSTFCRQHHLALVDPIDRQLTDLAAVRLPSSDAAERERFVEEAVAPHGRKEAYGNWIYLPWDAKVVHLLGPDAYFEVITNRNHDKITREEQRLLRSKRIGVIGLSVGGEAGGHGGPRAPVWRDRAGGLRPTRPLEPEPAERRVR